MRGFDAGGKSKWARFPADPLKRHLGGRDPKESCLKSVCKANADVQTERFTNEGELIWPVVASTNADYDASRAPVGCPVFHIE